MKKKNEVVKIEELYRISDGEFKIFAVKDIEKNKYSVLTGYQNKEFVFKGTKKENIERIGKLLTKISKI